jgi:hypothetical protein
LGPGSPTNQRLYVNGSRVAQMSDMQALDLNSAALGIGWHVSGIADPDGARLGQPTSSALAHD